jgi:hypothetical protein
VEHNAALTIALGLLFDTCVAGGTSDTDGLGHSVSLDLSHAPLLPCECVHIGGSCVKTHEPFLLLVLLVRLFSYLDQSEPSVSNSCHKQKQN